MISTYTVDVQSMVIGTIVVHTLFHNKLGGVDCQQKVHTNWECYAFQKLLMIHIRKISHLSLYGRQFPIFEFAQLVLDPSFNYNHTISCMNYEVEMKCVDFLCTSDISTRRQYRVHNNT